MSLNRSVKLDREQRRRANDLEADVAADCDAAAYELIWLRDELAARSVVKCPVCDGSGLVSRPPHVAGDQPSWVDSGTGPHPCKRCAGVGTLTLRDT